MKKGTHFILPLICLLLANITLAQKSFVPDYQDPLLEPWRWKHFPEITKYGIMDMIEDDDGLMWFAVHNGLLSYDGYTWTEYEVPDNYRLGTIFDIGVYKNKIYLLARYGTFYYNKFNGEWHRIINTELLLKSIRLINHNILIDRNNGSVYLSTNSGMFYYNGDRLYFYTLEKNKEIADTTYSDLTTFVIPKEILQREYFATKFGIQSSSGEILILNNRSTKGGGVLKVAETGNPEDPLKFSYNAKIEGGMAVPQRCAATYVDENEIWIVGRLTNKKVSVLKDDKWNQFSVCELFGDRDIYNGIEQMDNGNVILAGEGQLYVRRNNEWKRYQKPDIPVTSTGFIIMYKTRSGDLWIGGEANEFYYVQYSDQNWKTYKNLFYQFTDHKNTKWFLSSDSKVVYNKGENWYSYDKDNGLIDSPTKIVMAKNNMVWCTGSDKGIAAVCYLDNNEWHKISFDTLSQSIEPRSVFIDKDSSIFFGGTIGAEIKGGIIHLSYDDINSIKIEHWTDGIPEAITGGIVRDKQGKLMVMNLNFACEVNNEGKGIFIKDYVRGKSSTSTTGLKGELWLGTENNGFYIKNVENTEHFNTDNGLISNVVTNICVDSEHSAWIATEKDITHYDGETWINSVFSGNFIIEKEAGDIKADDNGSVWINMVPRKWMLKSFYPDIEYDFSKGFYSVRYQPDTTPPQCNFDFYTKEVDPAGNSHITWKGIDYGNDTKGDNLLFSYQLNDEQWTPFKEGNDKTFLSLASGDYTLKLKAKDRLGNTSLLSDQVFFKVQRPVYLRPWFLIMISVFLLIISYLIRRIIKKNHDLMTFNIELKEQKEEIQAQNEEIQQQTEEITAQRDSLEEQNEEIKTKNEQISSAFNSNLMLSKLGKKITAELDVLAIFDIIYKYVNSMIHVTSFGIGVYDELNKIIHFNAFRDQKEEVDSFTRTMDQKDSLSVWAIENQVSVYINNMDVEYENYLEIPPVFAGEKSIKSSIIIPLSAKGIKRGVLALDSERKDAYTEQDFNSLQSLGSYISIALDNASAYKTIQAINAGMKESINYAKSIQSAFLPTKEELDKFLNCFVMFRPKDIVSGDFYWFSPVEPDPDNAVCAMIAVADCTGHGVPGALISSIGNNLLDKYINTKEERNPAQILELVNEGFQQALKQDETRNNDGMDMVLVLIEGVDEESGSSSQLNKPKGGNQYSIFNNKYKITFAGAKNPLIIYRAEKGELESIKGSRKSIGGLRAKRSNQDYENTVVNLQSGDMIYLITDGIIDQHSVDRDRFTVKRLHEIIEEVASKDLEEQHQKIELMLNEHMKGERQTDDITLIGIRL
ncbi:MAG: SpoIIE family protein phosphatase [Bacteroidales bacterium]|nr:SpoIIE family protein phosphatase [Bacteroidales bacterium]